MTSNLFFLSRFFILHHVNAFYSGFLHQFMNNEQCSSSSVIAFRHRHQSILFRVSALEILFYQEI